MQFWRKYWRIWTLRTAGLIIKSKAAPPLRLLASASHTSHILWRKKKKEGAIGSCDNFVTNLQRFILGCVCQVGGGVTLTVPECVIFLRLKTWWFYCTFFHIAPLRARWLAHLLNDVSGDFTPMAGCMQELSKSRPPSPAQNHHHFRFTAQKYREICQINSFIPFFSQAKMFQVLTAAGSSSPFCVILFHFHQLCPSQSPILKRLFANTRKQVSGCFLHKAGVYKLITAYLKSRQAQIFLFF